MSVKQVAHSLSIIFWAFALFSLLCILLWETRLVSFALQPTAETAFWWLSALEVITVCIIPFALRLMKFKCISRTIDTPKRLFHVSVVRLLMLAIPMTVNTLAYYFFQQAAFGYLAIMLFISMLFIYPSVGRSETELENVRQNA